MKEPIIDDFAALIGIDWADKKHDICEMPVGASDYQFSVISSKPQALHDWALSLKRRYPDKPVAIACELKKGPLIYALSRYEHITIFPINPSTVGYCQLNLNYSDFIENSGSSKLRINTLQVYF